jgi:hypothetical protein
VEKTRPFAAQRVWIIAFPGRRENDATVEAYRFKNQI